jgi:hypothetical protein
MLAANASPNFIKTGMLALLNIGILINKAPTLKKIRNSTCNWINGIENDSIFESRRRAMQ